MSFSKYTKRRAQFEVLEAKQLFAADLVGGVAADLPDTPVVAGFDPGDLVAELDPGSLSSVQMNPGDIDTTTDQIEVFFAQYGKFQHQILLGGGFFNVDMDDHDTDPHFQGENVWDPNVEPGIFSVKEADLADLQDADCQFEVVNLGCGGTGKLEVLENGLLRNCPARPQLPKK